MNDCNYNLPSVGDKFHDPADPKKTYKVDVLNKTFIYLIADGWVGPPRVIKVWKWKEKGFVPCH